MIIRPMLINDIDAVYEIECQSFSIPWSKEALTQELSEPSARCYVAELEACIAAYAGVRMVMEEGEVTNIAVAQHYRGNGIGRRLLQHLLDEAKKSKLRNIFLEVRKSNEAAMALYVSCGFQQIGLRKNYYQKPAEDAVLMACSL